MHTTLEEKSIMDSQDEDLKKLSHRTEELLSRLNELSGTLGSQLKSTAPAPSSIFPKDQPPEDNGSSLQLQSLPKQEMPPPENNGSYYTIPINTQYLEKREQSIKRSSSSGEHFMSTSSTAIFTEHHQVRKPAAPPEAARPQTDFSKVPPAQLSQFKPEQNKSNSPPPQQAQVPPSDPLQSFAQANKVFSEQIYAPQNKVNQAPPSNYESRQTADNSINDFINAVTNNYEQGVPKQMASAPPPKNNLPRDEQPPISNTYHQPRFEDTLLKAKPPRKTRQDDLSFRKDKPPEFTQIPFPKTEIHYSKLPEQASPNRLSSEPLRPSVILPADQQSQTQRIFPQPKSEAELLSGKKIEEYKPGEIDSRAQAIVEQISAKNQEIKQRLSKYSSRVQTSSKLDILKFCAWVVPLFALAIPLTTIKDNVPVTFAFSCIALFFGIFFTAMAWRLVEISELVRWAHNQIILIQTLIDDQRRNNKPKP